MKFGGRKSFESSQSSGLANPTEIAGKDNKKISSHGQMVEVNEVTMNRRTGLKRRTTESLCNTSLRKQLFLAHQQTDSTTACCSSSSHDFSL